MARWTTARPIEQIEVSAYRIPTDAPEADGTYAWTATTLVLVEATGGGQRGLGYTYADTATARLVRDLLATVVRGRNALDVPGCWAAMVHAIRNLGRPGIAAMAIAAVDVALWDLPAGPSLHVAPCCAVPRLGPLEYFHDHMRIEHMLFKGALTPGDGALHPDRSRPGLGLEFKGADAAPYAI